LNVEIATLKSPQRIEALAKNKLQMSYPAREQVIVLNNHNDVAQSSHKD